MDKEVTKAEAFRRAAGVFLLSLESELPQNPVAIEHAIVVQALFARRICLTDTQLIDSPALQAFFASHERDLQDELDCFKDLAYPPIFGTCSRKGADISAALDVMLTPNVRTLLPTYLSRLTPEENARLRAGFASLQTPEHRRQRVFKIAGRPFRTHIERVTAYFEQNPLSVVQGTGTPQATLFQTVGEQLTKLQAPDNRKRLRGIDHKICDSLLREMGSTSEGQTRERLHLAIYEGNLPHYYHGIPEPTAEPNATDLRAWRHLINTFYNFNLAEKLPARPVLNSRWFRIPKRLAGPGDLLPLSRSRKIGEVPLETPVYPEYLTIPFLVAVRSQADFWKNIERLESASMSGSESAYEAAFKEHLRLVSSLFAKHLKDKGRGDLVKKSLADVWASHIDPVVGCSTAVVVVLAAWYEVPAETIGMLLKKSLMVGGAARLVVNGFIKRLPIKVANPDFKSFEAEVAAVARQTPASL